MAANERASHEENISSVYLKDDIRRVDYVLVYDRQKEDLIQEYIANLQVAGLIVETYDSEIQNYIFAFVHGSNSVLAHFAIFFDLYLTMENSTYIWDYQRKGPSFTHNELTWPNLLTELYKRAPGTIAAEKPTTYTNLERSLIVSMIMSNTMADEKHFLYGYPLLIQKKIVIGAYPLHDGPWRWSEIGHLNDRQLLGKYWANINQIVKQQPLHVIEKYFGTEIALYFAFVEFFNCMLVPLSVFGILFFIYGILDVCSGIELSEFCASDLSICPNCAEFDVCPIVPLKKYCNFKLFTMFFDNHGTYLFAVVTVIWSFIFFVLWRRYQSTLQMKFNLLKFKYDARNRPEYTEKACHQQQEFKLNIKISTNVRVLGYLYTILSIVLIWILTGQFIMIVQLVRLKLAKLQDRTFTSIILASMFNWYMVWLILCPLLIKLGIFLTNYEYNRIQKENVDSNILKIVLVTFPLYFGGLLYLTLFKGNFYKYPGSVDKQYRYIALWGGLHEDGCNPAGCIGDVTIQLLVIFISDIIFATLMKYGQRYVWKLYRIIRLRRIHLTDENTLHIWEKEFIKMSHSEYVIHEKYNTILMRYAMVTFFSAACPLAPVLLLIYSSIKIRSDAEQLIKLQRKISSKVEDIGIWNIILQAFTIGGAFINMATLAFSSSYIPRLQYLQTHDDLKGYIKGSFSSFETKEYFHYVIEDGDYDKNEPYKDYIDYVGVIGNLSECYYHGYRFSGNSKFPYENKWNYWSLVTGKLFLLLVSENILLLIGLILYYAVPRRSKRVILRLKERELEMYGDRYALPKESKQDDKVLGR